MKKSAEQRLRETKPDLMDYLERLWAPVQAGFKKLMEETDFSSAPDLLKLPETHINPSFYIQQQVLERTPGFKQFHEKTGGDIWAFMDTPEGEIDPAVERLDAIADAFHSTPRLPYQLFPDLKAVTWTSVLTCPNPKKPFAPSLKGS